MKEVVADSMLPGACPVFRPLKERVTIAGMGFRDWARTLVVAGAGAALAVGLAGWTHTVSEPLSAPELSSAQSRYEAILEDVDALQERMESTGASSVRDVDATESERESWEQGLELGIRAGMSEEQVDALVPDAQDVEEPVIADLTRWLAFCIVPTVLAIGVQFESFQNSSLAAEFGRWRRVRRRTPVYASDPRRYAVEEGEGR